jgi:hypothetical protein
MNMNGVYAQFDHWKQSTESLQYASNFSSYTGRLPAYIGFTFCVIMVCVFASASWWVGGTSPIDVAAAFGGPALLILFWLSLKLWRFYKNDDFKWWETINTWTELKDKLDGLSNAIRKRDVGAHVPENDYPMQEGLGVQSPSQTPLVDGDQASGHHGGGGVAPYIVNSLDAITPASSHGPAQYPGGAAADAQSYPYVHSLRHSVHPADYPPRRTNSPMQTHTGGTVIGGGNNRGNALTADNLARQQPRRSPPPPQDLGINVPPQATARTTGFNSLTSPRYPSYAQQYEQRTPMQLLADEPWDPHAPQQFEPPYGQAGPPQAYQPRPPTTRGPQTGVYQGTTPYPEGTAPYSPPRRRPISPTTHSSGSGGRAYQPPPFSQ